MSAPLIEEHTPDGSRPLVVSKPSPEPAAAALLQPSQLTAGEETCISVRVAARMLTEPPTDCRRVVEAGDHYLRFVSDVPGATDGIYCAPCAINNWRDRGVVEADVP